MSEQILKEVISHLPGDIPQEIHQDSVDLQNADHICQFAEKKSDLNLQAGNISLLPSDNDYTTISISFQQYRQTSTL